MTFQTGACPYCRGLVEVATAAPPGAPITCHHCATPSRVWQVLAARRRLEADAAPGGLAGGPGGEMLRPSAMTVSAES